MNVPQRRTLKTEKSRKGARANKRAPYSATLRPSSAAFANPTWQHWKEQKGHHHVTLRGWQKMMTSRVAREPRFFLLRAHAKDGDSLLYLHSDGGRRIFFDGASKTVRYPGGAPREITKPDDALPLHFLLLLFWPLDASTARRRRLLYSDWMGRQADPRKLVPPRKPVLSRRKPARIPRKPSWIRT